MRAGRMPAEKAAPYAENWTPTAEKLWNEEKEKIEAKKNA